MKLSSQSVDRMVLSMERALSGLEGRGINRRISEQNLLLCLIHVREILLDVLGDSAGDRRAQLIGIFAMDCGRVARIRVVGEETVMHLPRGLTLGTEGSARLIAARQCIAACDSVEAVLHDLGYSAQLRSALQKLRDQRSSRATDHWEHGSEAKHLSDECTFFNIFTPRDVTVDRYVHLGAFCGREDVEPLQHQVNARCLTEYQAKDCKDPIGQSTQQAHTSVSHIKDSLNGMETVDVRMLLRVMDEQDSSSSLSSVDLPYSLDGGSNIVEEAAGLGSCDTSYASLSLPTLLKHSDRQGDGQGNSRRLRRGTHFNSLKCMFSHGPDHSCPGCARKVRNITLPF